MMRSMNSAISALRNHQIFMDVIASNISNVNTVGFKASRVSFQELLNQTMRGGSAPQANLAGINPLQVGLGMSLGGVDTLYTQGSLSATGKQTDLAIQGDGFFVLDTGTGNQYTRDGALDIGLDGTLVNPTTGMRVLGWTADDTGTIDTTAAIDSIRIPFGQNMARATSQVQFQGNVDAGATTGDTSSSSFSIYDSLGVMHSLTLTFTRSATANQWDWTISESDSDMSVSSGGSGTVTFDGDGQIQAAGATPQLGLAFTNGADASTVTLELSDLTQLSGTSEVNPTSQDGLSAGSLSSFNVSAAGELVGVFSNGLNRTLGQLTLAKFLNPGGLMKVGQNLYNVSANSGTAQISTPGKDGRGLISAGYLEMSNVDLAQQFTDMIVAQRGFQANSRVITASDEMLRELVNMSR